MTLFCQCCGTREGRLHQDVDLWLVCDDCQLQLRFAHSWLKVAGYKVCSHEAERRERRPLIEKGRSR